MIVRKVEKRIIQWINESKKALLVSGARQVGKTYTIRKCLENQKVNYLEINLIRKIYLKGIEAYIRLRIVA